ncbi:uncharacterized protein LOC126925704 [Bombus affinis]|uniref:uncharacterized protein LOC126925704 n=1 Tax=Bombus affinis TaxID=309941 RepID=UPI0021B7BC19|nr:uncharacterized protein LOC126925704 [Bombus affinis]
MMETAHDTRGSGHATQVRELPYGRRNSPYHPSRTSSPTPCWLIWREGALRSVRGRACAPMVTTTPGNGVWSKVGTIIEQSSRDIKKHILGSLRDPNHLRLLRTRIYCDQRLIFFHNITKEFLVLCDAKLNRVLENLVQSRFPANLRTCFSPVSPFVLQLA